MTCVLRHPLGPSDANDNGEDSGNAATCPETSQARFLTMPETAMSEPVLAFLSDRTEDPSISARLLLLTDSMPCGRNGRQVAPASRRHT